MQFIFPNVTSRNSAVQMYKKRQCGALIQAADKVKVKIIRVPIMCESFSLCFTIHLCYDFVRDLSVIS